MFDEKFPVHNSLEQQVFTLGMHLICVSSGSYLQATEVSTYSSLLTLWMGSNKICPFYSIDNYSVSWYFTIF